MCPTSINPYLKIHDSLLHFQRKHRLMAIQHGAAAGRPSATLGFAELSVIRILSDSPDKNIKELAELVNIERSWMSRVITSMLEKKLIRSFVPELDRRSKKLRISRKGKESLIKLDAFASEVFSEALKPLSDEKQQKLFSYLKNFADALDTPEYSLQETSHPIFLQMGRISMGLGVFGGQIMGTDLNLTQLHVLYQLAEAKEQELLVIDLNDKLPFDMSTISRTVASFEKTGIIEKEQSAQDRRSFKLKLSSAGTDLLKRYQQVAISKSKNAMSSFSKAELEEFHSIIETATQDTPSKGKRPTRSRVEVKKLSAAEKTLARKLLVQELNDDSAAADKELFALYVDSALKGAAEISRNGDRVNLTLVATEVKEQLVTALLKSCIQDAKEFAE